MTIWTMIVRWTRKVVATLFDPAPGIGARLGEAGQWRLLSAMYNSPDMAWANLFVVAATGILSIVRLHAAWTIVWSLCGAFVCLLRLLDFYSFPSRRSTGSLAALRKRFTLIYSLVGVHWGSAAFVLLLTDDPVLRLWFMNAQAAVLASLAARGHSVPQAARAQVVLILFPLLTICVCSGDLDLRLYAFLVLMYMNVSIRLVGFMYTQTVRLLLADEEHAALLRAGQIANERLEELNLKLQAVATTDGLTGVSNRRSFDATLEAEWMRARREGRHLGLLLIDIDHFKNYNDRFGHQAGDACLRRVAACIAASVGRPTDMVARYGGEEFAVILPSTDLFGAMDIAERIRAAVQALVPPPDRTMGQGVTISTGVACMFEALAMADPAGLIALADKQLYRAKHDGRNCVRAHGLPRGVDAPSTPGARADADAPCRP